MALIVPLQGVHVPIWEYQAKNPRQSCDHCREVFEQFERRRRAPLKQCPECGAPVIRRISASSVGASKSGLDNRAKSAGFHKLKKLSRGEYEKIY